jgi:hypothetical protein
MEIVHRVLSCKDLDAALDPWQCKQRSLESVISVAPAVRQGSSTLCVTLVAFMTTWRVLANDVGSNTIGVTQADCFIALQHNPVCADSTWQLWNTTNNGQYGGFFCCDAGEVADISGNCYSAGTSINPARQAIQVRLKKQLSLYSDIDH